MAYSEEPASLVVARGLAKVYPGRRGDKDFHAVKGIDFRLRAGEAFGFLGPNGAGKSTTMRMIASVLPPTSGSLRVLGMDPVRDGSRIRARIGVIPQEDALDAELTVRENLLVYGRYFGLSRDVRADRADRLLAFARLADKAGEHVRALSGGMRRRLAVARSLVNEPEILLLDEPTTGLDPQARHELWERLFQLKEEGVALILTTHYMDEAEQLCDRLAIMDDGRIVAEDAPRGLIDKYASREVVELRFPRAERRRAAELLAARPASWAADRVEALPDRLLLYSEDGERTLAAVLASGARPDTGLVRRAGLEDVFLSLTGRSLVD